VRDDAARDTGLSRLAVAFGATLCVSAAAVGADSRWLAALGHAIVQAGSIPAAIPYAAAPSGDWVNVPVLGELVFHWLEVAGGERGILLAQAAAVTAALALLLRDMRAAGAPDAARAAVIAAVPFAALPAVFVARAQLFSLALFPVLLVLLRREAREPSRRIWLLVPLVALWSNLHGAVLVGLAVAAVYLIAERFRRQPVTALGVLVASAAALFATPALISTADYYLGVFRSAPATTGYGLWAPLSLGNALDVLFVAIAAVLLVFALLERPAPWELACLVLLTGAAVHASRNSVWVVLFLATPAARGLGRTRLRNVRPARRVTRLCAWCLPVLLLVTGLTRAPVPTVAGATLRAQAADLAGGKPILADAEDAERLALDGRRVWISNPIDAFDRADQRLYLSWLAGKPAGDAILRGRDVVLARVDSNPQRRLALNAAFREVARDRSSVLYERRQRAATARTAPT
jgi:hypothetical protein